jgi:hypothetical protein
MKKQYIVIAFDNAEDCYIVNDLKTLITEMYEEYTDKTEDSFYRIHKVIEVMGEIREMN